jgi:hypothetical protein
MTLHCIICTAEIPEKRARRNAITCSRACKREWFRLKIEEERRELQGNTCPTCCRYVPLDTAEVALVDAARLIDGLGHGNAARFA